MKAALRSGLSWPRRLDGSILAANLAFSLTAMALLVCFAIGSVDRQRALAILVYGGTLVACSLCSFLYNTFAWARWRSALRYLDHAAIFLLIAGTYTPFASSALRGPLGFSVLAWVWALACTGVVMKLLLFGAYDRIFVGVYVAIGWFIVAAGREAVAAIAAPALVLLVIGGLRHTAREHAYLRGPGRPAEPRLDALVHGGSAPPLLDAVPALVIAAANPRILHV